MMNGLKYIRDRFNFTLQDLATRIGVSRQALSMWEQNLKPIPTKRQEQLSKLFGVPACFFGEITDEQVALLDGKKAMTRFGLKSDSSGYDICEIGLVDRILEDEKDEWGDYPHSKTLVADVELVSSSNIYEEYRKVSELQETLLKSICDTLEATGQEIGLMDLIVRKRRLFDYYESLSLICQHPQKLKDSAVIYQALKAVELYFGILTEQDYQTQIDDVHNPYAETLALELLKIIRKYRG